MHAWLSRVASSATGAGKRRGGEGNNSSSGGDPSSPGGSRGGGFGSVANYLGGGPPLSAEDVARGQQITEVCEKLVREIQRILRSAKEAQHHHHQQEHQQNASSRWAGTEDLLALLAGAADTNPSPPSAQTRAEEEVVEEAGPVISLGSLEPLMDHPHFVSRCLEAALPPNLGHCLRLMRVIELENASPSSSSSATAITPLTVDATARVARLLVRLCQQGAVVEQLRLHLEGLFKLTTASYPPTGAHVQAAAFQVVEAISSKALSSSLIWFIHDRQIVMKMVEDLFDLCLIGGSREEEAEDERDDEDGREGEEFLVDYLLLGPAAEKAGMWLVAAKAIVCLVCNSCRHSAALVADLHEARGYDVFRFMIRYSTPNRRSELLAGLALLVGTGAESQLERTAVANEREGMAALGNPARNIAAFEVLRDVLVDATPVLRAVVVPAVGWKQQQEEEGGGGKKKAGKSAGAAHWKKPPPSLGPQAPAMDLTAVARRSIEYLRQSSKAEQEEAGVVEEREELQLQLLSTLLQIYSNHPRNYASLEPRFHALSLYLACLSSFRSPDLKLMVIKTLEYVCSGVANCAPTDALHAAAYTFMACCETFLEAHHGKQHQQQQQQQEEEAIVAVNKALHENVEMVCGTLEKLMQFDHQFVEVLGTTGVLGEVFYPLLARAVEEANKTSAAVAAAAAAAIALGKEQQTARGNGSGSMLATPAGVDEVVCLACRVLVMMLQETPEAASRFFRGVRLQQILYDIIGELGLKSTLAAVQVLQLAALADHAGLRDDMTCLIELLQSCRQERWRQLVVLKAMKDMLTSDSVANDLWRSLCGFEATVAALSSLDGAFLVEEGSEGGGMGVVVDTSKGSLVSEEEEHGSLGESSGIEGTFSFPSTSSSPAAYVVPHAVSKDMLPLPLPVVIVDEAEHLHSVLQAGHEQEICLELIKQIIRIITLAVSGKVLGNLRARVENRQYLKNEIGYDTLKCCLLNSKVLTRERFSRDIVECIFMMVTEETSFTGSSGGKGYLQATVKNADAALLLFSLLTELPRGVATYILQKLLQLIANSTYVAAEQLCLAGALRQVLDQFYDILNDPEDPLYSHLLRLLYLSGRHRVTVPDTISMLRCLGRPLFLNKDGAIVLCPSFRRQVALHPELAKRRRTALEEQWKSLLILAELAETSDSVPFLRLGGGRRDLLALARKWTCEEPKEIGIMDFDSVYAATAYSEGMRFVMVPTVGGTQPITSSSGFSYSCWFRFGVEATDFAVSKLDEEGVDEEGWGDVGPATEEEGGITQQILWLFTVSSTSAKSSLQVYLDLTHHQLCVESYVGKGLDTELIPVDLEPGQWHHFMLVHRRARNLLSNTKNTLAVYLNGIEVAEVFKTDHVSFLESPTSRCFIGVPLPDTLKVNESVLRGAVAPIWHMGPVILTLEALPVPQAATAIYATGPSYVGSFQGERPVQSNIHAIVTALLARLHRGGAAPTAAAASTGGGETISALLSRGLQDVLRMDHRRTREEEALAALLSLRIPLEQVVFSFHAGHASPCEITPRNLSGTSHQNLDIYHEPCYRLVNTIGHLCEDARAQWGVVFGDGALMNPLSISDSVFGIAGPQILFPLLEVADSPTALCVVLELVRVFCRGHTANLEYMQGTGYRVMVFLLARKKHLFTPDVLRACVALAVDTKTKAKHASRSRAAPRREQDATSTVLPPSFSPGHGHNRDESAASFSSTASSFAPSSSSSKVLVDATALKYVVLNWELWGGSHDRAIVLALLKELNGLLAPQNPNAVFNAYRLHYLGLVRWTLSVMMQAAKLSSAEQDGGWLFPRISLEDAHWARTSTALPDKLLTRCGELLQRLLLTRVAESDVNDMASVLLSTVAQRPGSEKSTSTTDGVNISNTTTTSIKSSFHPTVKVVNVSALNGSKGVLSAQSIVRIYLLEILIKVLTREHDRIRQASGGGAQGVVKKVMGFFSLEPERLVGKPVGGSGGNSGSLAGTCRAGGGSGMSRNESLSCSGEGAGAAAAAAAKVVFPEDQQEILKAFSRCLSPDWFHSMLDSCRDALSISLTLRALFILFQEREDFVADFAEYDTGFNTLASALPRISASPIVLLPLFAVVVGISMSQVPPLPDLKQTRLYELLESLVSGEESLHRLPRPLFGALMTALMEGLNRNLLLGLTGEDGEVRVRAMYCVEDTLGALKGVLQGSLSFMEASKSKEFIIPVVQSVFACADVVDAQQQQKAGGRKAATASETAVAAAPAAAAAGPVFSDTFKEELLTSAEGSNGGGSSLPPTSSSSSSRSRRFTTMDSPFSASRSSIDARLYFEGAEAQRLFLLLELVLRGSFFAPTGQAASASTSAHALVREAFLAFPHTAMDTHIFAFYERFLLLLTDLVMEALSSGDGILVGNTVAVCSVLFEVAQQGLLPPSLLATALELCLNAAREISGTRINKSLGSDLQQLLLADAISIGQAFSIVALRRAARYVDATRESEAILATMHAHLHLLLSHTKRPVGGTASLGLSGVSTGGVGSMPPRTRAGAGGGAPFSTHGGKWRKTFVPSAPLDETGTGLASTLGSDGAGSASVSLSVPSTPSDMSKSVNSMSSMLSRPLDSGRWGSRVHEMCLQFGPDKGEPFVACLLSELRAFLLCGSEGGRDGRRRLAARVCEVLLKQRQNVMAELLSHEIREKQGKGGGKEKKILDIYSRGFLLLLSSSGGGEGGVGRGEEEADARLERFEEWFSSAEAGEAVTQVFGVLQDKAVALLPDDMIPTVDVLNRLQAAKVPAFSLGQSSAHARLTRGEQLNVRKAFETFINFHQHIIRSGLADIANGSMHWKEVLCSLRGVVSVWEGVDVQEGKEENRWATANPEAKEATVRSLHQNFMWKLDLTEGPERMRRRMKRNYEFEEVYNVMEQPVLEPFVTGQLPSGVVAALEEEGRGGKEEEELEGEEEKEKQEEGEGEGGGDRAVCTPPGRSSSTGGGGEGGEGGAGARSLVGSASASSLEGMLIQDVDFDLRATTKLIKQVALVHMHSGVGRGGGKGRGYSGHDEYDEEDLFDLYEGEDGEREDVELPGGVNRAADDSQPILDVDMTEVGEKKKEEIIDLSQAEGVEAREQDGSLTLAGSSTGGSSGEGEREEGSPETKTPSLGREMVADSVDLGATACPFNDTMAAMEADGRIGTTLGDSVNIVGAGGGSGGGSSTMASLDVIRDGSQDTSSSTLPPALRTQVSMADIDSSHHLNASGSLALLAMEAAAAGSESNDGDLVANELIAGFVDENDGPILRLYNVQRCTGLEVSPALLLFCRHGLVIVDGFAKVAGEEGSPSGSSINIKRVALSSTAYSNSNTTFGGANSSISSTNSSSANRSSASIPQQGASGVIGVEDAGSSYAGASSSSSSSTTTTTSSLSTEDLDHRFNVYLRAPNTKGDNRRPSAEAICMNKVLNNLPLPSSSICNVPPSQGAEKDESRAKATASLGRIGFDLENPPHVERMRFDRLKILYKRRYQFRHVAIEFFDVDGRSFLVALQTPEEQTQVVDLVMDAPLVKSVFWSNNQDGALQKLGGGGRINYKRFMAHWRQQLTSKWQSGRMTNFEYLMHLNALAGRSVHDLTQYPVFPWVLSDYTSVDLDLNNPSVYRDLRKPMGALGETRAKQFRERFEQLASLVEDLSPEEAAGEAPPFHYGTHYSCAGYVLYYLLRLEPYARLHLQLQGGKFDKADRLFRDIKSSWDSASRENLQDVRELIPEFFYLPEFLTNHNQFDYGWLQKGLAVNHVMLPPWAKGDAREFVRLQRMALESKYVSENISFWIDLIFGFKQTGPEAVEAQNLFVHLTYEGVVDIDAIQDPVIREATIAQIHNFGQTPGRLFKRPHPVRRVPVPLQSFQQDEESLTMTGAGVAAVAGLGGISTAGNASNSSSIGGPSVSRYIDPSALAWHQYTTPSLCVVGAPQTIALRPTSTSQIGAPYGGAIPSAVQPVGDVWTVKDRAVGVGLDCALVPPNLVKYVRYGSPDYGLAFRVAVPTTRNQYVDRVVSVHEQLHLGAVNCLALDEAGELAVTGSKDSTVRVWCMSKQQAYAQPPQLHLASGSGGKTLSLQATLCGHSNEVLCVDVAAQLGILLSGGADRLAVAWDVRGFTSQRLLVGHASPVTSVSINKRTGDMVTLGGVDIRVWSVTGEPLAQVSAIAVVKEVPTCVVATDCPEWQNGVVAVTGHDNGKLCLWGLQNLSDDRPGRSVIGGEATAAVAIAGKGSRGEGDGVRGDRVGDRTGDGSNCGEDEVDVGSNTGTTQGRQLRVMQILQGVHTASITALRVGRGQRDLAVGDAMGRCSRWASVRLDQLPEKEIMELAFTARRR